MARRQPRLVAAIPALVLLAALGGIGYWIGSYQSAPWIGLSVGAVAALALAYGISRAPAARHGDAEADAHMIGGAAHGCYLPFSVVIAAALWLLV